MKYVSRTRYLSEIHACEVIENSVHYSVHRLLLCTMRLNKVVDGRRVEKKTRRTFIIMSPSGEVRVVAAAAEFVPQIIVAFDVKRGELLRGEQQLQEVEEQETDAKRRALIINVRGQHQPADERWLKGRIVVPGIVYKH